jgi:hypothetical protein
MVRRHPETLAYDYSWRKVITLGPAPPPPGYVRVMTPEDTVWIFTDGADFRAVRFTNRFTVVWRDPDEASLVGAVIPEVGCVNLPCNPGGFRLLLVDGEYHLSFDSAEMLANPDLPRLRSRIAHAIEAPRITAVAILNVLGNMVTSSLSCGDVPPDWPDTTDADGAWALLAPLVAEALDALEAPGQAGDSFH